MNLSKLKMGTWHECGRCATCLDAQKHQIAKRKKEEEIKRIKTINKIIKSVY